MSAAFSTNRPGRQMALTHKDIAKLSAQVGRDVRAELVTLAQRHWPVVTFGQLLRALAHELRQKG